MLRRTPYASASVRVLNQGLLGYDAIILDSTLPFEMTMFVMVGAIASRLRNTMWHIGCRSQRVAGQRGGTGC